MLSHRIVLFVTLTLEFATPRAHAFFDPPWITPPAPTASDIVSVNIRGGMCDGIIFQSGYPQLTQTGNSIRLVEYGVHVDFADFCIYPVGTYTEALGTFPPGDYTLTVDFTYDNYPLGLTTITLGVIPFIVTGTRPVSAVPALTTPGTIALLAVLAWFALGRLRARRRRR